MTVTVYIGIHSQLSSNSENKRTDKRYTYDILINLFKRQAYVLPIQAPWLSYVILGCSISIQICLFCQHDSLPQIYFQTTFVDVLLIVKDIIPIAACQVCGIVSIRTFLAFLSCLAPELYGRNTICNSLVFDRVDRIHHV